MLLKLISAATLLVALSGCAASYNPPSKSKEADIVNDKNKAYVIFGVEKIGHFHHILEYFPETETFKPVTIVRYNQKYIYPVDAGTHYFYRTGEGGDDFLRVDTGKGKKYFVRVDTDFLTFNISLAGAFGLFPATDKESIEGFSERVLVDNSQRTMEWFKEKNDDPEFITDIKEMFLDWREDEMKDETMFEKDGVTL